MRKPAPTSSRNYFTKETDEWVVKYNQTSDPKEKEKIFQEHLYFPFYKLAENIINTFKFYHMDVDSVEDLKLDVITMIIEGNKLEKFNPDYGTKAFSYFGTVIKKWLIAYCNTVYNRKKKQTDIKNYEDVLHESRELEVAPTISLASFFDNWIEDMYEQLDELFPDEGDKAIADAVLTVFKCRQNLQLFQKKEIYIYVREITGCDTPYLTKVVKVLKQDFMEKYQKLLKEGLIRVEESES